MVGKLIVAVLAWIISIVSIMHVCTNFNIKEFGVMVSFLVSLLWFVCIFIIFCEVAVTPPKGWYYRFRCKECDQHVSFKESADPCQACGGDIDSKPVTMALYRGVWTERVIWTERIAPIVEENAYKGVAIRKGEKYAD